LKIDVCIPTKLRDIPQVVREAIVREIPYNRIILERTYPLSEARMRLIKKAKTEWFLFVDDDIILGKDWFKIVSRYMIKNVGAIEGVDLGKINREYIEVGRYERGLLCATLIRKDAVYDWKPRKGVETNFEDYDLTQHVIKKGFRWLRVNVPGTHSIEIHPHASQTGFETLLGPAFSHRERIFYILNLLRLEARTGFFSIIDMAPNYIYSISLWLKKIISN